MKYIIAVCFSCVSISCSLGFSSEGDLVSANPCTSVITSGDVQALNNVALNSLQYSSGKAQLSAQQMAALDHLKETKNPCGLPGALSVEALNKDLQVMEILAMQNGPFSLDEVKAIRKLDLEKAGLTLKEINILISIDIQHVTHEDLIVIQKYIALIQVNVKVIFLMIPERAALLRIVAQNIGKGFTLEDLETLRKAELILNGLSIADIEILQDLVNRKDPGAILTALEIEVLKKWILVENLPSSRDIMDFKSLAALHEIIQSQSSPPFSPKELLLDERAFQRQLENAPLMEVEMLKVLKQIAENLSSYLGGDQIPDLLQLKACESFVAAMLQFGRVPGLSPIEVGQLLQLIEMRVEFQNLMFDVKSIRYIELIKSNFTLLQKRELDVLRGRSSYEGVLDLSKEEARLLKVYILKAKQPGGLNGFGIQYRADLFSVIQHAMQNGNGAFTLSDLEILRRVEQLNNGFSEEEIYQIKVIGTLVQKNQELTLKQAALLKRFIQVERQVGFGRLIDLNDTSALYQVARSQPRFVDPESEMNEERNAPVHRQENVPSFSHQQLDLPDNKPLDRRMLPNNGS